MQAALYNISFFFYEGGIRIASLFNNKAKLWMAGRKNLLTLIKSDFKENIKKTAWFHCASLGEFEQGRPVLEGFRKEYPEYNIVLTFFSPSGFENKKNYKGADYIYYLPLDTSKNANNFINIINPTIAIFVKYEFWYYYIDELHNRKIPIIFISSIFRKNQIFFKWYGNIFRKILQKISHIFVQDKESKDLLSKINISHTSIAPDTRFDKVYQTSLSSKRIPFIEEFTNHHFTVIAGSTWFPDEQLLLPMMRSEKFNDVKFIIIPHEIKESHISALEKKSGQNSIRYSHAKENNVENKTILIIDNIGMLSSIYKYGAIAYIGGGFGKGIHNILEAAAFGLPVLFGPNYHKFKEANDLILRKCAFTVHNSEKLQDIILYYYNHKDELISVKEKSLEYIKSNTGGTNIILDYLKKLNL